MYRNINLSCLLSKVAMTIFYYINNLVKNKLIVNHSFIVVINIDLFAEHSHLASTVMPHYLRKYKK